MYSPIIKRNNKVGRNDPCFCGSGKKYKKCCLAANLNNENEDGELQIQQNAQNLLKSRMESNFKDQQLTFGTSEEMGLVSMTKIIVEFVEDFLDMADHQVARENVITFGIAAWNLALMSEYEGKDVMSYAKDFPPLKEAAKDPELGQALTSLLLLLVERKRKEYPHINRYIGDFTITKMKKDGFQLNIVSALVPTSKKPKKPFFSGLLSKLI